MIDVARRRSRVSGSVVYWSRGNPANAESAVFRTTRPAKPRRIDVDSRVARHDRRPLLVSGASKRMRMRDARRRPAAPTGARPLRCAPARRRASPRSVPPAPRRTTRRDRSDRALRTRTRCSSSCRWRGTLLSPSSVDAVEGALERDVDREVDDVVRIGACGGPSPAACTTCRSGSRRSGHVITCPRYVEYPNGLRSSGT